MTVRRRSAPLPQAGPAHFGHRSTGFESGAPRPRVQYRSLLGRCRSCTRNLDRRLRRPGHRAQGRRRGPGFYEPRCPTPHQAGLRPSRGAPTGRRASAEPADIMSIRKIKAPEREVPEISIEGRLRVPGQETALCRLLVHPFPPFPRGSAGRPAGVGGPARASIRIAARGRPQGSLYAGQGWTSGTSARRRGPWRPRSGQRKRRLRGCPGSPEHP